MNVSNNGSDTPISDGIDGPGFANGIAVGISANGTLTSLNIGSNNIPIENMNEIMAIVEAKPAMKVLCAVPFRDKAITELDVSGQSLGVEGALVIRRYLENNGALTSLDISSNQLAQGRWNNGKEDYDTDTTGTFQLTNSNIFFYACS